MLTHRTDTSCFEQSICQQRQKTFAPDSSSVLFVARSMLTPDGGSQIPIVADVLHCPMSQLAAANRISAAFYSPVLISLTPTVRSMCPMMSLEHTIEVIHERSPEIAYTLDLDGNFKFLNAAGESLWGYSCEEICRMNMAEILAPEFASCIHHDPSFYSAEPFGLVYEIEILTKDRRRLRLETSAHLEIREQNTVEIQGIAVLIAEGTHRRIRCVDSQFEFGPLSPMQP
ncbi:MAG TPA: PAS domain-containing protein [Pyrinomonadaceae bacterium]|nr:PAS domain-containing protein [Pyrinomonadaceae bacterium]